MINRALILGRLGQDPNLKYTSNGTAYCALTIATSEKTKKDGQLVENTEWHNVRCFGSLAENCGKYLKKGSLAYVEGKINTESYDCKKSGVKKYVTKIMANSVKFISTPDSKESNPSNSLPADVPF